LGIDHQPYRSLDPLADLLRLVYHDHRGNGRSSGDPATMTMSQWAADAATLGAQVSGGTRAILLGHSFGGFIAQEAAIAHPGAVAALILITTTPGRRGHRLAAPSRAGRLTGHERAASGHAAA
jgi:proline iminopeptidase